ncbi:hypothetical protein RQP46_004211 [Phenoliferia psychrophenolica]
MKPHKPLSRADVRPAAVNATDAPSPRFPPEVVLRILGSLAPSSPESVSTLIACQLVSRNFYLLARDWSVWGPHVKHRWTHFASRRQDPYDTYVRRIQLDRNILHHLREHVAAPGERLPIHDSITKSGIEAVDVLADVAQVYDHSVGLGAEDDRSRLGLMGLAKEARSTILRRLAFSEFRALARIEAGLDVKVPGEGLAYEKEEAPSLESVFASFDAFWRDSDPGDSLSYLNSLDPISFLPTELDLATSPAHEVVREVWSHMRSRSMRCADQTVGPLFLAPLVRPWLLYTGLESDDEDAHVKTRPNALHSLPQVVILHNLLRRLPRKIIAWPLGLSFCNAVELKEETDRGEVDVGVLRLDDAKWFESKEAFTGALSQSASLRGSSSIPAIETKSLGQLLLEFALHVENFGINVATPSYENARATMAGTVAAFPFEILEKSEDVNIILGNLLDTSFQFDMTFFTTVFKDISAAYQAQRDGPDVDGPDLTPLVTRLALERSYDKLVAPEGRIKLPEGRVKSGLTFNGYTPWMYPRLMSPRVLVVLHWHTMEPPEMIRAVRAGLAGNEDFAHSRRLHSHVVKTLEADPFASAVSTVSFGVGDKTLMSPIGETMKRYTLDLTEGSFGSNTFMPVTVIHAGDGFTRFHKAPTLRAYLPPGIERISHLSTESTGTKINFNTYAPRNESASVVKKLISLGAIIVGKDKTSQFAKTPYQFEETNATHRIGKAWYGDAFRSYPSLPQTVYMSDDVFPLPSTAAPGAQKIYTKFYNDLADFLNATVDTRSLATIWNSTVSESVGGVGFADYLNTTYPTMVRWAYGRSQGEEGYNAALVQKQTTMDFISNHVLKEDESSCSDSLFMYPIDPGLTQYRNLYHGPPTPPFGFAMDSVSPFAETPEISIPLGQIRYNSTIDDFVDFLPVSVAIMARKGCDYVLLDLVAALQAR